MMGKIQKTLDAFNERLLQAEKRVGLLETLSTSSREEIVKLMRRLEKLEPDQPCPGARMRHEPKGNQYCEECRG